MIYRGQHWFFDEEAAANMRRRAGLNCPRRFAHHLPTDSCVEADGRSLAIRLTSPFIGVISGFNFGISR